jgi:hypothetical protein
MTNPENQFVGQTGPGSKIFRSGTFKVTVERDPRSEEGVPSRGTENWVQWLEDQLTGSAAPEGWNVRIEKEVEYHDWAMREFDADGNMIEDPA